MTTKKVLILAGGLYLALYLFRTTNQGANQA